MANHSIPDEAAWHAVRAKNVGGSEVGALFGLSPWLTRWQLYMLKTGKLPDAFENTSMTQGKHFEPAVAAYAQERFDIRLRKVRRYMTCDDCPGLGATLDYEEYGGGTLTPTELKWSLWGDGWEYEGQELTQIPDSYMMQVQTQLACMPSAPNGQLIAFTAGDLKRMVIPRDERLVTAIKDAVRQFWVDVAAGNEPPVDFSVDADAVTRLAYIRKLRSLTMTPDKAHLFEEWRRASEAAKAAEETASERRAEVLKAVIDAGEGPDTSLIVTCGDWRVSLSKIADNPGKEIRPEDVGTRLGARKGYLRTQLSNVAERAAKKK